MIPKKEPPDQHAARQIIAPALKNVLPGSARHRFLRYDDRATAASALFDQLGLGIETGPTGTNKPTYTFS